ncbi:hypothetical protein [Arthrobacter sp. 754]|uniref:hypothetical protein n=1 Tax=Arthrobacter sp. 754 TaxID=3156315 RepID=UPI003395336E
MNLDFVRGMDGQAWANLLQSVAVIVTLVGVGVALVNGAKDRKPAMRVAASDRVAADERAADDRRAADRRAEGDRQHTREQAQQQFHIQQALRLTQLVHEGRPDNPSLQTAWQVEIHSLLSVIGESAVPPMWQRFMVEGAPSTGDEASRREISEFVQQLGR